MKHSTAVKAIFLFYIGFTTYISVEVIYRGRSHWSMGIVGGLCFLLIGLINNSLSWDLDLSLQMLLAAGIVTIIEFVAGLILNVWLHLEIWDYSNLRFNLLGQVSVLYTLAWVPLSLVAILLDDWIRHYLFGEKKPTYKLFGKVVYQ